jgi:hypothetical protein
MHLSNPILSERVVREWLAASRECALAWLSPEHFSVDDSRPCRKWIARIVERLAGASATERPLFIALSSE